jgi:hypothetical protein
LSGPKPASEHRDDPAEGRRRRPRLLPPWARELAPGSPPVPNWKGFRSGKGKLDSSRDLLRNLARNAEFARLPSSPRGTLPIVDSERCLLRTSAGRGAGSAPGGVYAQPGLRVGERQAPPVGCPLGVLAGTRTSPSKVRKRGPGGRLFGHLG